MKKTEFNVVRKEYEAPVLELFVVPYGQSILEIVSLEGEIEDFEDGYDI